MFGWQEKRLREKCAQLESRCGDLIEKDQMELISG